VIFFRESNTDHLKDNVQHGKIPSDVIELTIGALEGS
jgi:hypothetical protein